MEPIVGEPLTVPAGVVCPFALLIKFEAKASIGNSATVTWPQAPTLLRHSRTSKRARQLPTYPPTAGRRRSRQTAPSSRCGTGPTSPDSSEVIRVRRENRPRWRTVLPCSVTSRTPTTPRPTSSRRSRGMVRSSTRVRSSRLDRRSSGTSPNARPSRCPVPGARVQQPGSKLVNDPVAQTRTRG